MTESLREQLLGHLLGALEDSEQEVIEARLKRDPQLRREWSLVRKRLEPLEAARCDFDPPAGLAERTCRLVALQAKSARPAGVHRRPMTPEAGGPSWVGRVRWLDVAMAAGIVLAASLLIFPAIQNSRFQAQLAACQHNLRELGVAMKQYSRQHGNYFPRIPIHGKASVAGVYGPMLLGDNLLSDVKWVVCPGSKLAGQDRFSIPSLEEIQSASEEELDQLRQRMGGSYGYCLGYIVGGRYQGTKDLNRSQFALMSDAPGNLPGYQSLNHGGRGQNVLFEDGRVQFLTSSKPYEEADDFFANDLGLVAAGVHPNDSVIAASFCPLVLSSPSFPPIVYVGDTW